MKNLAKELALMTIPGVKSRIRSPYIKVHNLDEIVEGINEDKQYSKQEVTQLLGAKVVERVWKEQKGDHVSGRVLYNALTVEFPSVHQLVGVLKNEQQKRLLYADEAGTGKTAQVILLLPYVKEKHNLDVKTLIVCPKNMIEEWQKRLHVYLEPQSEFREAVVIRDHDDLKDINGTKIVIVNYEKLNRTEVTLEGITTFVNENSTNEEFKAKVGCKEVDARKNKWNEECISKFVSARLGKEVTFKSLKEACAYWAAYEEVQEQEKLFNKLIEWRYNVFVLDEGHLARNPDALRTKAAMALSRHAQYYAELTATPVPHSLENLARTISSLIGTVDKGVFTPKIPIAQFEETFKNNAAYTGAVLRAHMVRRTLESVDRTFERKKLNEELVKVSFDGNSAQRDAYIKILRDNELNGGEKVNLLRRVCIDPQMTTVYTGKKGLSVKYEALFERLDDAVNKNRFPLVYSVFKDGVTRREKVDPEGKILIEQLMARYNSVAFIDGNTSEKERRRIRDASNAGDIQVLLVTAQSMPFGVDLSGRDEIHHLDLTFLPDEYSQQNSRVFRRGQDKNVNVFTYCIKDENICIDIGGSRIKGSIDEGVLALHDERKFLGELVFSGASNWSNKKLERLMGDDPCFLLQGYLP